MNATHLNQDAHLLYLDVQHDIKGSGVAMFALSHNALRLVNNHLSWDPFVGDASINGIQHAVKRVGNTTAYEWEIYIGERLQPNTTIGIDHVIVDMDEEDPKWEYSTIAWGSNGWKSSMQNNLGDVLIIDPHVKQGSVQGTVGWQDDRIAAIPWGVQFINTQNHRCWTQLPLRGKSDFKIALPPGEYQMRVALPSWADTSGQYIQVQQLSNQKFQVKAGHLVQLPDIKFSTTYPPDFHKNERGFLLDFNEKDTVRLDGFLEKVMAFYNIPGLSLACIKNGEVVYLKNYGVCNDYTKEKVTNETLFDIGSVTKTIFAVTIMRLVESGQLDLDKPLYEYLPYTDLEHDERYKILTARQVLSHQTGLPNWRNGQLNFINDPGVQFGYSGEGFQYLKLVVEKITGKELSKRCIGW